MGVLLMVAEVLFMSFFLDGKSQLHAAIYYFGLHVAMLLIFWNLPQRNVITWAGVVVMIFAIIYLMFWVFGFSALISEHPVLLVPLGLLMFLIGWYGAAHRK